MQKEIQKISTLTHLSALCACFMFLFTDKSFQDTVFISFQNGLGNEELVADLMGKTSVLGGLTAQGANIEGPGHIRAHTNLTTWIGEMDGVNSSRVQQLVKLFSEHGLPCQASLEIKKQIWCKLLYNLAVSPMSTITDLSLRWG